MRSSAEQSVISTSLWEGLRVAQRRFTGATVEPKYSIGLSPNHPALSEARTIFPKSVVDVADSPRLLVSGHNNPKLGSIVTKGPKAGFPIYHLTLEERATCPTSCSLWDSCYGNTMPFARRHAAGDDLARALISEVKQMQAKHPTGFMVRLHTLGDFYSQKYVYTWKALLALVPALHCFGFTAHPRNSDIGRSIVETVNEIGWDRFAIRFSGEVAEGGSAVFDDPAESDAVIMCPAQTEATECCATCGLCWADVARPKTIGFLKHGMKKWRPDHMGFADQTYRKVSDIEIGRTLDEPGDIKTSIPSIEMLALNKLVIDTRYQRVIRAKGRSNIRHIVENFDWMHFQPILVSPITVDGEQLYTVIDGQHRALAALNHPDVDEVPAAIVELGPKQQAHVFAEINSRIVKVDALEIYWARFASGDEAAQQIMDCVEDADIEMARAYPAGRQNGYDNSNWQAMCWIPKLVGDLIDRVGFGYASMSLGFARDWCPEEPAAINCEYMVHGFSRFLHDYKVTDPDPYIKAFAEKYEYSEVKDQVSKIILDTRDRPASIFYNRFLLPTVKPGAIDVAA